MLNSVVHPCFRPPWAWSASFITRALDSVPRRLWEQEQHSCYRCRSTGLLDVLASGRIVLDPSRVAAQIVTGIGFIGAGLIFVEGDRVRGLTTGATVWLVTAVGMACGAGLPILALAVTFAYFVIVLIFPRLLQLLPGAPLPVEQANSTEHDCN